MKILIVYLLFAIAPLMSQNVGINATGSTPHSSSGLDIDFTDRGVLIPRLSDAQRNSIVNPAAGLLIYNTTTQCMNMFNGSGWRQSCFECTFQVVPGSVPATCEGDTLHLSTNSILGASYLWIGPNGFSSSNQNPKIPSVGLVASGVYSVTATLAGCTSSPQNVSATIIAKPNQPNASSNSPVIPGNTLQLFSSNVIGATYSWTGPNGGSNGSPGGACTYSGGLGGNFNSLAIFSSGLSITAGAGGAGGTLSHSGGGGGGGVQITGYNVNGFDGVNNASAKGGRGFGGGGGGGGYNGSNGIYYQAGNGAPGLVYIEW